jgi:plasmid stabilization system protein ParE
VSVRYAESALADLAEILAYLDERSLTGGRNVMRSIQKAAELIGEYRQRGRLVGEGNVRVVQAGRYPYLIYWEVEAETAIIVHIRHAARRPWREDAP